MTDEVRRKQLFERVERRIKNLRSELESSFGQPLSDEMLKGCVYEEISRRAKASIEAALKDFESGEELMALKDFMQQAAKPPVDLAPIVTPQEVPVEAVSKASLSEAKAAYQKFKRGKK